MFDQIFGNYLVASGYLSQEEFQATLQQEKEARVKLGLIAVTDKLMTVEQADEVNQLQMQKDMRFGDIAVEKGYLTQEQVDRLLKKQGNVYMVFVQTLLDNGLMTLEEVDTMLKHYQAVEGLSDVEMDDLVSGDIDRTISLYMPENNEIGVRHCGIVIRSILRLISSYAYVSKAYMVNEITADNFAMQEMQGDHTICAGFAGIKKGLLTLANPFSGEDFDTVDLDALDAVGEFVNCVNGLFASELSTDGVDVDMLPPAFYDKPCRISGDQFIVLPIHIDGKVLYFVLAVDAKWEVENLNAEEV